MALWHIASKCVLTGLKTRLTMSTKQVILSLVYITLFSAIPFVNALRSINMNTGASAVTPDEFPPLKLVGLRTNGTSGRCYYEGVSKLGNKVPDALSVDVRKDSELRVVLADSDRGQIQFYSKAINPPEIREVIHQSGQSVLFNKPVQAGGLKRLENIDTSSFDGRLDELLELGGKLKIAPKQRRLDKIITDLEQRGESGKKAKEVLEGICTEVRKLIVQEWGSFEELFNDCWTLYDKTVETCVKNGWKRHDKSASSSDRNAQEKVDSVRSPPAEKK